MKSPVDNQAYYLSLMASGNGVESWDLELTDVVALCTLPIKKELY